MKPGKLALAWLAVLLLFFLLSMIPSRSEPTSKVTWEDRRGLPIAFVQINRYTGPCAPEQTCSRIYVAGFDPLALVMDILILGVLSVLGILVILKWLEFRSRRDHRSETS